MKCIIAGKGVLEWRAAGQLVPGVEYWIPNATYDSLREYEKSSGFEIIADVTSGLIFNTFDWHCKNVLVWNTGGIGDQLWMTALIRAIKQRAPMMNIDVVCGEYQDQLWERNDDVRTMRMEPIPDSLAKCYDGLLFLDQTVANLVHADQRNCYTELFDIVGLTPPSDVHPIVRPVHTDEVSIYSQLLQPDANGMVHRTRGHFVVGLHSSSKVRDLPQEELMRFVATLASQAPSKKVYVLSSDQRAGDIGVQLSLGLPNVIHAHKSLNYMQIAALCRYASCVIAPDSMLVHMAASQLTPCVALMSTVPPQYRVSTYEFCVPIYKPRACKYDECFYKWGDFSHHVGDTVEIAKCYSAERKTCDIMAAVTTVEIFEAMNIAMRRKNERGGYDQTDLKVE